jgi:hypothetical protein
VNAKWVLRLNLIFLKQFENDYTPIYNPIISSFESIAGGLFTITQTANIFKSNRNQVLCRTHQNNYSQHQLKEKIVYI